MEAAEKQLQQMYTYQNFYSFTSGGRLMELCKGIRELE